MNPFVSPTFDELCELAARSIPEGSYITIEIGRGKVEVTISSNSIEPFEISGGSPVDRVEQGLRELKNL